MTTPTLLIDLDGTRVEVDGTEVMMTRSEWEVFLFMWRRHPGWTRTDAPELAKFHVSRLRRKLEPVRIETRPGFGWRLANFEVAA